ncbi:MAG: HRDC domain-containing protein [Bacteroidia bacterium]|nr:HRDC domain-containing protein [Bacteroidia bacterium]
MQVSYTMVQTTAQLEAAVSYLEQFPVIGMDLEGEFNLHRYGMHLCLLQLSEGKEVFLLDPLSIEDLEPFFRLYENPDILKISHGPHSDFLLLDNLYGRNPKNIFDTQKAAIFLGLEGTSLSALLMEFFEIEKNTKIRENDWGQRPLPDKMLNYAAKDVLYLPELYEIIWGKLVEMGRHEWAVEENRILEQSKFVPKENPHLSIKGASKLTGRESMVLKGIHAVREEVARELDKPASYVIQNPRLIELAMNPPKSPDDWREMRQVHPRLKQYANLFHEAVQKGLKEPVPRKKREFNGPGFKYLMLNDAEFRQRYNSRKEELTRLRELLDKEVDIAPMVLSSKTIHRLASGNNEGSDEILRKWQKDVILEAGQRHGIPVDYLNEIES